MLTPSTAPAANARRSSLIRTCGAVYRPRCPWSQNRWAEERPELRVFDSFGQRVACHFAEDILSGELRMQRCVRSSSVRVRTRHSTWGAELIQTRTDLPAP